MNSGLRTRSTSRAEALPKSRPVVLARCMLKAMMAAVMPAVEEAVLLRRTITSTAQRKRTVPLVPIHHVSFALPRVTLSVVMVMEGEGEKVMTKARRRGRDTTKLAPVPGHYQS